MSSKVNNLGIPSIDSLKIRLEVSALKGFDQSLLDTLVTLNTNTSEVEKEFKRQSKKYYCKEYSFYASYNENVRISKDKYVDCITLLINSKQLKYEYFKGITIRTIESIYKEIIKLGIIDCSLGTFLSSAPTDIDIKADHYLELDNYKELIKVCSIMTKESSNRDNGCTTFKAKDNLGIAWSTRQTSKYKTNPYLKIYHKGIELTHNSIDFYNEYLTPMDVKHIIRIETTVKNRTHLKSLNLGSDVFTLKDLLELTETQLKLIIQKAINCHLLPRSKGLGFKTKSDMTPSNRLLLNSILGFTNELNWSIIRTENYLLNSINDKTAKYRKKKLINELYNDHIKNTNYDYKSTQIDNVFDAIGWF